MVLPITSAVSVKPVHGTGELLLLVLWSEDFYYLFIFHFYHLNWHYNGHVAIVCSCSISFSSWAALPWLAVFCALSPCPSCSLQGAAGASARANYCWASVAAAGVYGIFTWHVIPYVYWLVLSSTVALCYSTSPGLLCKVIIVCALSCTCLI